MTPSKEEIAALVERVRGLKGADREADALICIALQYGGPNSEGATNVRVDPDWDDGDLVFEIGKEDCCNPIPALTGSVDAALALVDRVLPGWDYIIGHTNGGLTIHCQLGPTEMVFGETTPLAILLALLLSLQSQEPTP